MDHHISSVWFKVSGRGIRTLHLAAIYREHTVLRQDHVTDNESQQTDRWRFFINQWITASRLSDCIIIGDTNLDQLKWGKPDQINVAMTNLVKDNLETRGFSQLVTGPTRIKLHQYWTSVGQTVAREYCQFRTSTMQLQITILWR